MKKRVLAESIRLMEEAPTMNSQLHEWTHLS